MNQTINPKLLFLLSKLDYTLVELDNYEHSYIIYATCYVKRKQIDVYHNYINKHNFNIDYLIAHEIIHATGLKFNRDFYQYELEESIAEVGAYLLLISLGISVKDSYKTMCKYVTNLKHFHSNKFIGVYYDAEKAIKYLLNLYYENKY